MPFLKINGLTVSVADGSAKEQPREIGARMTSFDGTSRKTRLGVKRDLSFETTPLVPTDAVAWDGLIRGLGEHWSFDTSLYGSKGTGPNAGYVASQSTASFKFGAGKLSVSATTGTITFATGLGSNWTVMFWRFESGAWHNYIVCSNGNKWYDGVQNNALSTTFLTVSSSVTIANSTASAVDYDDLVVLPFVIPTTWPATLGVATSAFSDLPKLTVTGDAVAEASSRTMLGDSDSGTFKQAYVSGVWYDNLRVLSVVLSEV